MNVFFERDQWYYMYIFHGVFAAGKKQQELGITIIIPHLSIISPVHLYLSPILTA
jgi:hypothetical protein